MNFGKITTAQLDLVQAQIALLDAAGWVHRVGLLGRKIVVDLWHPGVGACRGYGLSWFSAWQSAIKTTRLVVKFQRIMKR